jgi:Heterokaryon incompatibility protein (HET)
MLCGIDFNALAKTFQHAVVATRQLGIRYLWIDSLCILQGDTDDWANEASYMGNIYAGCLVNFVAAAAPDDSVGCFFDRGLQEDLGFKVYAKGEKESGKKSLWNCYLPEPDRTYTDRRAWCFQETFLAPRSIYFHRDQLYWRCRLLRANETFPQGLDHSNPPLRVQTEQWHDGEPSIQKLITEWMGLVPFYTRGSLTYWKDRLIAVSGIARVLRQKYSLDHDVEVFKKGAHYLAGLWRHNLEQQLLWYAVLPWSSDHSRPPSPYGPTWSWASVYAEIGYQERGSPLNKISFNVVEVEVELETNDEYGPVAEGRLKLQCHPLVLVTCTQHRHQGLQYLKSLVIGGEEVRGSKVFIDEQLNNKSLFALHALEARNGDQRGLLLELTGTPDVFRRVASYIIYKETLDGMPMLADLLPFCLTRNWEKVITII